MEIDFWNLNKNFMKNMAKIYKIYFICINMFDFKVVFVLNLNHGGEYELY